MSSSASLVSLMFYLKAVAPYAALGGLFLAIIATLLALAAHRRVRKMTIRNGDSLEDTLGELTRRVKELQVFREELEDYLKDSEGRLQGSIRGIGIVRFNPFHGDGSGGNQSFALAFLNDRGDGLTLSALYTRGGATSVYAKPIEKFSPQFALTEEEEEALRKARENLKIRLSAHPHKEKKEK